MQVQVFDIGLSAFPLGLVKVVCHVMSEPVTKYWKIVNIRASRPLMTIFLSHFCGIYRQIFVII